MPASPSTPALPIPPAPSAGGSDERAREAGGHGAAVVPELSGATEERGSAAREGAAHKGAPGRAGGCRRRLGRRDAGETGSEVLFLGDTHRLWGTHLVMVTMALPA